MSEGYTVLPVRGIPEVRDGDDVAALVAAADVTLHDGDVVVVTSKVLSKAEGRHVRATSRDAAITAETVDVVARRGDLRIVRTRHGLVMAAAGVDASNTEPGTVLLLPLDPDASARGIRRGLAERLGVRVAVVVTDTAGRAWREGLVDLAIGVAGLQPLDDLRGQVDPYGNPLEVTVTAVADEIAAAAELVKGKTAGIPVAVVRGLGHLVTDDDGPGARALVRRPEDDLFALGVAEARALERRGGDALASADVEHPTARGWQDPKDDRLVPYGETNLGTPVGLHEQLITPTDVFFVRSNYRLVDIDAATWRLRVHGLVERELDLGVDDLRAMPQRTVVAFIECSGNSRTRFDPPVPGTPWEDDAIGNASWTGVPLAEVLALAGISPDAVDVVSQGADDPVMQRGLPVRAALDPDTLVALQMNGADLLPAHGAPARLVVPGWGGIASTKWLTGLEVVGERFEGHWNAHEYVLLDAHGNETGRVEEMPVKSVIVSPAPGASVPAGPATVHGYAWSGRGEVVRVEVSTDGGATYAVAEVVERAGPRSWVRFEHAWHAELGAVAIRARATDTSGATQPDEAPWNAKGYQMNAVAQVDVTVA